MSPQPTPVAGGSFCFYGARPRLFERQKGKRMKKWKALPACRCRPPACQWQ